VVIRNLIFAKSPDFPRNATGAVKAEQGFCSVLLVLSEVDMSDHQAAFVPITVTFPRAQLDELKQLAEQEDRPLASMVRRLVAAGIEATFEPEAAE
jgi:hypothetical protein